MSESIGAQYFKDVLRAILTDQQKEAAFLSLALWGISIICAGLLLLSYFTVKRKSSSNYPSKQKKKQRKNTESKLTLREKYKTYSLILALLFIGCQAVIVIGYLNTSAKIHKDIESEAFADYDCLVYDVYNQNGFYHATPISPAISTTAK